MHMKIISWNVNGIRAIAKKGFLEWVAAAQPDILCIQETKAWPEQVPPEIRTPVGYHSHWSQPSKKGYSGVVIFSRDEPETISRSIGVEEFDAEGRVLMAEYDDFTLFNVYFPNGRSGPQRLLYKMAFYDRFLEVIDGHRKKGKPVIFCGDLNTAHKPIDLEHPKANESVSGFLPMEREWMDKVVAHRYIDTFRHFDDSPQRYTWWDYKTGARERNVGWRLDYFFVSDDLLPRLKCASIMADVMGSDHCPVSLVME